MSFAYGNSILFFTKTDIVIPSVAANTTVEIALTGLSGVKLGDCGYVVPTAAPIVGFAFQYFRGTGDGTGVVGVQNVTEGAIDPADTMDFTIVVNPKQPTTAAV